MKLLARIKLDGDAERVRQADAQAIAELQDTPIVGAYVIQGVVLPPSIGVPVPHRLGKQPSYVGVSAISGAATVGMVQNFDGRDPAGNPVDRTKVILLVASGYTTTITVSLLVVP